MPTNYTDQFFVMDPANPPGWGDLMTVQDLGFTDQDDDGYLSPSSGDSVNGSDITHVWVSDWIYVYMDGAYQWIEGVTFYADDGNAYFTPIDGTELEDAYFIYSTWVTVSTEIEIADLDPPCFVKGTRIRTERGNIAVEDLRVGDMVLTKDNGPQPIRWIGSREVDGTDILAPIRFAKGAIGNKRPLLVSPQHRMLITGWQAELHFGIDEALVAAKHLVNGSTITVSRRKTVTYFHILFDAHQIVKAEGAFSESFHPGEQILRADRKIREELAAILPDLYADDAPPAAPDLAKPELRGFEVKTLAAADKLVA